MAALALVGGLFAVWRMPETVRSRQERSGAAPGVLKGRAPILLGGMVIGVAFGVLSVFVPVSRIGMAPGRTGLFFFTYFLGLLGLRTAAGLGLTWLARPRILLPAYAIMVGGSWPCRWGSPSSCAQCRANMRGQPRRPGFRSSTP